MVSYPHTPIILLSPLAEGADRLVARVALRLKKIQLIVPLPMRKELYEKDFTKRDSLAEFDKLLNQAEQSFVLPVLDDRPEEEICEQCHSRDLQYEQVGAYIARHSQIVIALWDGLKTELVGGTAKIIEFQREGVPEPYAPHRTPLDVVESGPVYHIMTPRSRDKHQTAGQPFTLNLLYPKGYAADWSVYDRVFKTMDAFNEDAIQQEQLLREKLQDSMNDLFPEEEAKKIPSELQTLREHYGVADRLAIYFQGRTRSTLNRLFILISLAALCFGIYAHLLPGLGTALFFYPLIITIYLFIIAIAHLWVHHRAKRGKYQNKYQDYRTLAEGMRVQFFWCLAGLSLKKFKHSVADHYLRKQKSELDWIRHAIRVWNIPEVADSNGRSAVDRERMTSLNLLLTHWIRRQASYFTQTAKNNHEQLESNERLSKVLLWFGVGVTIALALSLLASYLLGYEFHKSLPHDELLHGSLILLMTLPPVGAALLHNYTEKTALSEHVKQYSRMSGLFSKAEKQLDKILHSNGARDTAECLKDAEAARELIEELGKEALVENGDWILLHRERPVDPPHAV